MADIEWLIEQIDSSHEGPQIGAFFDFDGTLIAGYPLRRSSSTACVVARSQLARSSRQSRRASTSSVVDMTCRR